MVDQVCRQLNQLSLDQLEEVKSYIPKVEAIRQLMSDDIIKWIGVETLAKIKTVDLPENYETLKEKSPHLLVSIKDTESSNDISPNEYKWLWPAAKGKFYGREGCFLAVWFRTGTVLFHELFFKQGKDWISSKMTLSPRRDSFSLYICPGLKMGEQNWQTLKDLLDGKKPGGRELVRNPSDLVPKKVENSGGRKRVKKFSVVVSEKGK